MTIDQDCGADMAATENGNGPTLSTALNLLTHHTQQEGKKREKKNPGKKCLRRDLIWACLQYFLIVQDTQVFNKVFMKIKIKIKKREKKK